MAKKKKVDKTLFKRPGREARRRVGTRELRQSFLIVCEGEKTEPYYFRAFERDLPNGIVTVDIIGARDNTINIVNIAIDKRDARNAESKKNSLAQPYDQVWAVFDRDGFPAERFNNAIFKAEQFEIGCAYSNQAFELWYLLYFDLHEAAHNRKRYRELLSNYLGCSYQKNDPNM